jgi:hypothetical protein
MLWSKRAIINRLSGVAVSMILAACGSNDPAINAESSKSDQEFKCGLIQAEEDCSGACEWIKCPQGAQCLRGDYCQQKEIVEEPTCQASGGFCSTSLVANPDCPADTIKIDSGLISDCHGEKEVCCKANSLWSQPCQGAWLDQNLLCRSPSDGVYDDQCCAAELATMCAGASIGRGGAGCAGPSDKPLPEKCCQLQNQRSCEAINQDYRAAVDEARKCTIVMMAPVCEFKVDNSLVCPCEVSVNSEPDSINTLVAEWQKSGCAEKIYYCPAVMCAPAAIGKCEAQNNTTQGLCAE